MEETIAVRLLQKEDSTAITTLTRALNPELAESLLLERQNQMFEWDTYRCFGFYVNDQLIGVSSGWITIRLYSGKQLELDNVIIQSTQQSKGYGHQFLSQMEAWALENACETLELNTYVHNSRSHKFYFNEGYQILGFHFQKRIG